MNPGEPGYLKYAMFNADVVPTAELRISPVGSGFMFGEGFFETVAVKNSRPVFFPSHHARLTASLGMVGATGPFASAEILARCNQVIEANALVDGSVKIVVFKDGVEWSELIFARGATYGPARYEAGFRLKTTACGLRVGVQHGLKSLNYLENIRAKRAALAGGFDDALFVDPRGLVLEGATSNVFIVKDGVVGTPALNIGILPGVMRAQVISLLADKEIVEREIALTEAMAADEVFVTNALLGIMPVARIDATTYDLNANRLTRSLMAKLVRRISESV